MSLLNIILLSIVPVVAVVSIFIMKKIQPESFKPYLIYVVVICIVLFAFVFVNLSL